MPTKALSAREKLLAAALRSTDAELAEAIEVYRSVQRFRSTPTEDKPKRTRTRKPKDTATNSEAESAAASN